MAETRLDLVTARLETRHPRGTGWYAYRGTECQGGPWGTEDQALDATSLLYEATTDQMDRFSAAAVAAGHESGLSAATRLGLWRMAVADAIAALQSCCYAHRGERAAANTMQLDRGDDGTVGVVDGDTGEVIAVITPVAGVSAERFAAAMLAIDPDYEADACGHG